MISSGTSTLVFVALTLLYITLKQVLGYKYKNPGSGKTRSMLLAIYIIAAVGAQYYFNSQVSKSLCGSTQVVSSFLMTVLPNLFMFGAIIIIFNFFPGWKAPFSNTMGLLGARMAGVRRLFLDMLTTGAGKNKLVQEVYDNPELMINEITPTNFDTFMLEMKRNKLIGPGANKYFNKLYKIVTLKDSISECMWFLLVGCLVVSTSYNALTEITCKKNTDAMIAAHNNWAAEQNTVKPVMDKKIYYTRE